MALLTLCIALVGCISAVPVTHFAEDKPDFDPIRFFTGHTRSWGVIENRAGDPTGRVLTDCVGEADGPDALRMIQHLTDDEGTVTTRLWQMRRTGPSSYEATANDMKGIAIGEAAGRAFHWRWVLAATPDGSLHDVTFSQWMYLMDDGAMMNRTVLSKFGVTIAEVSEQFSRVP